MTRVQLVAAVRTLLRAHDRLHDPFLVEVGGVEGFVQAATMNAVAQGWARFGDFRRPQIPEAAAGAVLRVAGFWLEGLPRRDALDEEEQVDLGEVSLHGRLEHAFQVLLRMPGARPGQVKRALPASAWDAVKKLVVRPVDDLLLASLPARGYRQVGTGWPEGLGPAASPGPGTVLMLWASMLEVPLERRLLEAVTHSSYHSGHPVVRGGRGPFTLGWVRYDWIEDVMLIEEVQTDLAGLHKQATTGNTPDAAAAAAWTARMLPVLYEDLLALAVAAAWEQPGIGAVELHDAEAMAAIFAAEGHPAPPRSVYTELPRKAGFRRAAGYRFPELIPGRVPTRARPWRLELQRVPAAGTR